jgi:hypothetical protein
VMAVTAAKAATEEMLADNAIRNPLICAFTPDIAYRLFALFLCRC